MMLLGKPHGAGLRIPWAPWPPTHPPTIPNVPATETDLDESAEHVLSPDLTETQQDDVSTLLQRYPDRFATGRLVEPML